jgi:sugar (pentulose or hexulose) kinase
MKENQTRDVYFLGVDSGSQSTKVSVIDQRGAVICSATQPLRPMINRQPGWVEHPDEDLWDSLKVALRRLFEIFEGDRNSIAGIGLCSIRCCRVFLKRDGSLAAPVMSWMDIRAYQTYEDSPEIAFAGSTSGYLTYRLTGEFKDTIANQYQYQFPTDLHTWKWTEDQAHFDSFRIPSEKLMEMHLPGEILGRVTPEAAAETGLPVGVPVVSTANDKAVEAIGSGLVEPQVVLLSLGTYITSMVFGDEVRPETANVWTNLSNIPYRYLYESTGIRGGMWHISWFKGIIGEDMARRAEAEKLTVEQLLEKDAAAVPAGSDGLLTVPDWLAPATELFRKGVMIGFDQRHTRGHIYRSIMEAITLRMKNNIDRMNADLGVVPRKMIVCGGGSNSELFMQIVADVFGVPASRNVVNGAAGLGAAISAAVATGTYRDFPEAVEHMVHERDSFTPDARNHALYTRVNEGAYRTLTTMLEPTLKAIHTATSGEPGGV